MPRRGWPNSPQPSSRWASVSNFPFTSGRHRFYNFVACNINPKSELTYILESVVRENFAPEVFLAAGVTSPRVDFRWLRADRGVPVTAVLSFRSAFFAVYNSLNARVKQKALKPRVDEKYFLHFVDYGFPSIVHVGAYASEINQTRSSAFPRLPKDKRSEDVSRHEFLSLWLSETFKQRNRRSQQKVTEAEVALID